jgi:chromosome segregation ATPase
MRRASFLVMGLVFLAAPVLAQSSSSDTQTLQAILQELRLLRQELRESTVASERAQILFYRMQAQQSAVARAQQRVDQAQTALDRAQNRRRSMESELKYETDQDSEDATPDAATRKRIEDRLPAMKQQVEDAQAAEQQAQTRVMTTKDQLQIEQGKLDDLQTEMDRIDKSLADLTQQPVK